VPRDAGKCRICMSSPVGGAGKCRPVPCGVGRLGRVSGVEMLTKVSTATAGVEQRVGPRRTPRRSDLPPHAERPSGYHMARTACLTSGIDQRPHGEVWPPSLARHPCQLPAIQSELWRWLMPLHLTANCAGGLLSAAGEAASNAMKHGYRHGDLIADDVFCLPDGPRALDCLELCTGAPTRRRWSSRPGPGSVAGGGAPRAHPPPGHGGGLRLVAGGGRIGTLVSRRPAE
jgi:hypothetical protein